MKVLSVIDSFKGTLIQEEINAILNEHKPKTFELRTLPISDGGEGFLRMIDTKMRYINISLFTGEKEFPYKLKEDVIYLEIASIIGFDPKKKDVMTHTSFAVGKIIKELFDQGHKKFIIGLGGSKTNDYGVGVLEAMGCIFNEGKLTNVNPKDLKNIKNIDLKPLHQYKDLKITIICDVRNPLFGEKGAAKMFSKQKGATKDQVNILEENGKHFVTLLHKNNFASSQSSGAAGGLGFIFMALFDATVIDGADFLFNHIYVDLLKEKYDVVITGEGKIDNQSLNGKIVFEVAKRTKRPVLLVCGVSQLTDIEIQKRFPNVKKIFKMVPTYATFDMSMKYPKKVFEVLVQDMFNSIL